MTSADHLASLYTKLLTQDSTKDLEIQMSDGVLKAHSSILILGSAAVERILGQGLAAETNQKRLSWTEHTVEVGKFFLRLLYSGTVEETEWSKGSEAEPCQEAPRILQIKSPNGNQQDEAGTYELRAERANGKPVWKKRGSNFWLFYCDGKWFVDTERADEDFTLGGGWIKSEACDAMPDAASGWERADDDIPQWVPDSDIWVGEPQRRVPLRLLLGGIEIAKTYLFEDLLEVLVEAVQGRVGFDTFDAILKAAIKIDLTPLRLFCVQYAKEQKHGVRELYDSRALSPEVRAELIGIWGSSKPPAKRRKI